MQKLLSIFFFWCDSLTELTGLNFVLLFFWHCCLNIHYVVVLSWIEVAWNFEMIYFNPYQLLRVLGFVLYKKYLFFSLCVTCNSWINPTKGQVIINLHDLFNSYGILLLIFISDSVYCSTGMVLVKK